MGKYAKFITAAVAGAAELVVLGVLPDPVSKWVAAGVAVVSAAAVYLIPNWTAPAPALPPAKPDAPAAS